MIDSPTYLNQGLGELDILAKGEYGEALRSVLESSDPSLAFGRVGRLMSVWYKRPFAESFPYDPDIPTNWAKARRAWEIHHQPSPDLLLQHSDRVDFLVAVSDELERPVEVLFEFNLWLSICKRLKPIVCGEAKPLERAEKVANDLRKKGHDVFLLTMNNVLGLAALAVANYLVQLSPWLQPSHVPVVSGCSLLVVCFGQNRLCKLLTNFIETDDPGKDRFADYDFPRCGSTNTKDGSPCGNRVVREGLQCWMHLRKVDSDPKDG